MQNAAYLLLAVFLVGTGVDSQNGTTDKELEQFQGTWDIISIKEEGKDVASEELKKKATMTFTKNTYKIEIDGKTKPANQGTFKIDPTKKPKHLNVFSKTSPDTLYPAIYKFEGDKLIICGPPPESVAGRPKEFSKDHRIAVLQRRKK